MAKLTPQVYDVAAVRRVRMRELHPLDDALLLMHFGFRGLVAEADRQLARHGLTRVHHRILYAVARSDSITVGQLIELLGVTKQGLHRPLKHLQDEGYVTAERDPDHLRSKLLRLTAKGQRMERMASECERAAMDAAFKSTSLAGRKAWREVMMALAQSA